MKYLYLKSSLHNNGLLDQKAKSFFQSLTELTGENFDAGTLPEIVGEGVSVVYIASGGTAGLFGTVSDQLPDPVILITSGTDNSLSASMEINTYMELSGRKARLLHGKPEEIAKEISPILRAVQARQSLKGMKFGMVGRPSDWLISTHVDYELLRDKLGIEVIDIEMDELMEEIDRKSYIPNEQTEELLKRNFDRDQVTQALHIYGAFDRLVEKYHLRGVSVRCFDLLTAVKNTGCLGLALLNAKGIFGGCEGDLPSLISMAILGEISGGPVFQSNPSRILKEQNEIIFAHCTLPLNMTREYTLKTHFESGIGVAIAGQFPKEPVTVFKASADLGRQFITSGSIRQSLQEADLCRSQMLVEIQRPVSDFLSTPVGNHYLIAYGNYVPELEAFFSLINSDRACC